MSSNKSGRRAAPPKVVSIQERWEAKKKGETLPKEPDTANAFEPLDLDALIRRLKTISAVITISRRALRELNVDGCDDIELVLRRHAESELLEIIEQLMDRLREVRHG